MARQVAVVVDDERATAERLKEVDQERRGDPPQTLIVCLDDKIAALFSKHVELTPEQIVVARDLALDDTAAANLALQCRLKTI